MKLIVGLGNPGIRYRATRHNVGFLVLKEISGELSIPINKKRHKGLFGRGFVNGEKVALLAPQTYMNLSGESVLAAVRKERVSFGNVLIVCDDINLKLGFIRLRKKGSSGGHNGLESIVGHLGTSEFPRLRVGVGRDGGTGNVVKFVLRGFASDEKARLKDTIRASCECAVTWFHEGADVAMARFNRRQ